MTKKISREVRQRIHVLHGQGSSVKDILSIPRQEQVTVSEKTIYRILKENNEDNMNNKTFASIPEADFDESFSSLEEDLKQDKKEDKKEEEIKTDNESVEELKTDLQETIDIIKNAVKEETQKVLSTLNHDISEGNDKLDQIIKAAKKNVNKPMNMSKTNIRTVMYNTDGMTEQEKNIRRDLNVKIRNYVDCFTGYEIIDEICGDKTLFKQSLYEKDTQTLNALYEEIQIGLNQSKDYEQFMQLFSTSLKAMEFVSNILLGLNLTGLRDDVLSEIDEFDLRQLACELSLSRYISPQKRIMLITLNAVLKKILTSSNLLNINSESRAKLYTYYAKISSYLKR